MICNHHRQFPRNYKLLESPTPHNGSLLVDIIGNYIFIIIITCLECFQNQHHHQKREGEDKKQKLNQG